MNTFKNRLAHNQRKTMTKEQLQTKLKDIQTEYGKACAQAGDMQYRIICFQEDLAALNANIKQMNQEASKVKEELAKLPEDVAPNAAGTLTVVPDAPTTEVTA